MGCPCSSSFSWPSLGLPIVQAPGGSFMKAIHRKVSFSIAFMIISLFFHRNSIARNEEPASDPSVKQEQSKSFQKNSVTKWSALGTGVGNVAGAFCVDGSNVYVGGSFSTAGGNPAVRIAVWNGGSSSALGNGLNNEVTSVAVIGGGVYAGDSLQQLTEILQARL